MGDLDDDFLNVLWQMKWQEPIARVEVVFAGFVDHANEVVRLRAAILENFVDFAKFQRAFVLVVPDANDELFFTIHNRRMTRFTLISNFTG
jgi:hypothetical protein